MRPSIQQWQVQQLRLTAFPKQPPLEARESVWEDLIGEPAESQRKQPRKGEVEEYGPWGGGRLTVSAQPVRFDWYYGIPEDADPAQSGLPTLGSFREAGEAFIDLMAQWLAREAFVVRRLALGSVLLLPVASAEAGYRILDACLPDVALDPVKSSDFLYQINRPRQSSCLGDLRINRLSKWSVTMRQWIEIPLTDMEAQGDEQGPALRGQLPVYYACRLELDINTAADYRKDLSSSRLVRLLEELASLSEEIAREGDIP